MTVERRACEAQTVCHIVRSQRAWALLDEIEDAQHSLVTRWSTHGQYCACASPFLQSRILGFIRVACCFCGCYGRPMHDAVKDSHWHEPKAGENAGLGAFKRPKLPYDRFMEDEGVPVYRGIGAMRVQDLPMAPWKRLGGAGACNHLYGNEGLVGMCVAEARGV